MTATDRRSPLAARVAMAPLHWIERSRGRRRAGLLVLYLLVLAVVGAFGWWAFSLNRLPDIGDPFDPARIDALIAPEDQNAFTLYREASARMVRLKEAYQSRTNNPLDQMDWAKVEEPIRRWLDDNHEALALWRQGTERDRALYLDPRTTDISTLLGVPQDLRDFGRLARLEASRLRAGGDLDGAWAWHRAELRSSRHAGRGGVFIQRLIGLGLARHAAGGVRAWMDDPAVDAAHLRRALADVQDAAAMTPAAWESLAAEYFMLKNTLVAPDAKEKTLLSLAREVHQPVMFAPGGPELVMFALREPERSLRVLRHHFAAWLDHVEAPVATRAPMVRVQQIPSSPAFDLFRPTRPGVLSPEALAGWAESSLFARHLMPAAGAMDGVLASDRREFANLELEIAGRLYALEHGGPPESIEALVGEYIDRVPEGYEGLSGGKATGGGKPN